MQVYSNELYHYGVVGMKWGVRRYQNPDGSLTSRGKKRYGTEDHLNTLNDYRKAQRQYDKDFTTAVNRNGIYINKKRQEANNERWRKANESGAKAREAYKKYKVAREEARPAIKEARKLTDDQKAKIVKGLKIGAAVAGTALAAYGAYKVGSKAIARNKLSGKLAAQKLLYSTYNSKESNGSWGLWKVDSINSITDFVDGTRQVYNLDGKTGKEWAFDYKWK